MGVTFNFKLFIRTFRRIMSKLCKIFGMAYLIAALLICLFPDHGLNIENMVPLWVVLGLFYLSTGLIYLWISESIKERET